MAEHVEVESGAKASRPELTAALRHYREIAAPGSVLAVSHASAGSRPDQLDRIADLYQRTGTPLVMRDRTELATLCAGWQMVEPGVVYTPEWRPEPGSPRAAEPASYETLAAVAVR